MRFRPTPLAILAYLSLPMLPIAGHAQAAGGNGGPSAASSDALEEVVVTAERRTSDLQKTALSITVRDGASLVDEGKSTLAQMLEDVPGVVVAPVLPGNTPTDNPGAAIVIRGVTPDVVLPGDSGVATTALYTDGVYQGLSGDYDINRIEVLRGPQGTLYGRSATSGVVSTSTNDPQLGKWSASGLLEYGSFDLEHASGALNIPIGTSASLRVAGNTLKQDSFLDGSDHAGAREENAGRVKLLIKPDDDLSVLLGMALQGDIIGEGGPTASQSAPDVIAITEGPTAAASTDMQREYWGQLNWNLGIGTLTYEPALRTFASDSPTVLNVAPIFVQDISNNFKTDQIHTEELRLASNASSSLSWIVGAWYYHRQYDYDETVIWEPSGGFSHEPLTVKDTLNEALFGELTLPFGETWRLTLGARGDYTRTNSLGSSYTFNLSEGSCNGVPFTPGVCTPYGAPDSNTWALPDNLVTLTVNPAQGIRSQDNFTYKVRLEKDLSSDNMLYAMASSGFLPGDLSVGQTSTVANGPLSIVAFNYPSETLRSFEVGSKNRFFENRLQVNGDVYYYDYSGYQQYINLNPGRPAPYFVTSASPARMFGAEFELQWRFSPEDLLGLSGGYVNARFVDKPAAFAAYVAQTDIPGISPLTLQARYDHQFNLPGGSHIGLGGVALYTDGYDEGVLAPGEVAALEPYVHVGEEVIFNARLGWTAANGKYGVSGYVRNVGNRIYKTGANDTSSITPSAPRVFGVVVHADVD